MWSVFHLVCLQRNTKKQVFEVTRYCKYASTLILKLFPTRFIKGYRWLCETHTVWKLKQYMYKRQTNEKIYCRFLAETCFYFFYYSPTDILPGTLPAERSDTREWNQPSSALRTLQTAA